MSRVLAVLFAFFLFAAPAYAQKGHGSHHSSSSRSSGVRASRPHYGGGSHTESHGGRYVGGSGVSSHKGGHYKNERTNNQYGTHKP
jgi:hypothetical protein